MQEPDPSDDQEQQADGGQQTDGVPPSNGDQPPKPPDDLFVPPPSPEEERRLLAEIVRDNIMTGDLLSNNGSDLVTGDETFDFWRAWDDQESGPRRAMVNVKNALLAKPNTDYPETVTNEHLQKEGLTGFTGRLKRNHINRLRDRAYSILRPDKDLKISKHLTKKDIVSGSEALALYFDACITLYKSLVKEHSYIEEAMGIFKSLCTLNAKATVAWMKENET